MATKKNLTPDERDRLVAVLREIRDELRQVREQLERKLEKR
jgi:hypothetical protein